MSISPHLSFSPCGSPYPSRKPSLEVAFLGPSRSVSKATKLVRTMKEKTNVRVSNDEAIKFSPSTRARRRTLKAAEALLDLEEQLEKMSIDLAAHDARMHALEDQRVSSDLEKMDQEAMLARKMRGHVQNFLRNGGTLGVFVGRGVGLTAKDTCISGSHEKKKMYTRMVKKTFDPEFNETIVFQVRPWSSRKDETVRLRAYDCTKMLGSRKFLGEVCIPLKFFLQISDKASAILAFQGGTPMRDIKTDVMQVTAWFYFGGKFNEGKTPRDRGKLSLTLKIGDKLDPASFLSPAGEASPRARSRTTSRFKRQTPGLGDIAANFDLIADSDDLAI